jgi:hypothetical protein
MTRSIVAGALLCALPLGAAAGQAPRRDGRWEMTMKMNVPGAPSSMPPMTMTQCITKEEADNPQSLMPQGRGAMPTDCKMVDQKVTGNKMTWSMKCEGAEAMSGTGEFVYTGDTVQGVIKMLRQGQTMTMEYTGKRLGDCVK